MKSPIVIDLAAHARDARGNRSAAPAVDQAIGGRKGGGSPARPNMVSICGGLTFVVLGLLRAVIARALIWADIVA